MRRSSYERITKSRGGFHENEIDDVPVVKQVSEAEHLVEPSRPLRKAVVKDPDRLMDVGRSQVGEPRRIADDGGPNAVRALVGIGDAVADRRHRRSPRDVLLALPADERARCQPPPQRVSELVRRILVGVEDDREAKLHGQR